jgi:uncharacterized membrane protein
VRCLGKNDPILDKRVGKKGLLDESCSLSSEGFVLFLCIIAVCYVVRSCFGITIALIKV